MSHLSVPASLHALIASRLDGLDVGDRSLLQAAAVIGKTFGVDALTDVSGMEADDVASRLRALTRRELLTFEVDPRSPEQGQYAFVQALVREVAYGTLAKRDRRRLHLAAARHFEMRDDEGIAGALAEHYVAAYRAQPDGPEGEAVAAQARVALRAAAERARSLGSFVQATRFLDQALLVTTDPADRLELHAAAADAGLFAGMTEEPIAHSAEALSLAREVAPRLRVLDAVVDHGLALSANGRVAEMSAVLEPARSEYVDLAESREYVALMAQLGRSYLLLGRSGDAVKIVDEALPTAERLDLKRETLELLVTRGAALGGVGRLREAIATLVGAVSAAESAGFTDLGLRGRVNLSYAAAGEDPPLAYRTAREGHEITVRLGMAGYAYYVLGNAAELAIRSADWEWLPGALETSIGAYENDGSARMRWAELRGLRGEDVEADLQALADEVDAMTEVQAQASVSEVRGLIDLAHGRFEQALERAEYAYRLTMAPDAIAPQTAMRAAAWLGRRAAVTEAHHALADMPGRVSDTVRREAQASLLALDGRTADAAAGFLDARTRWLDLGLGFEAALCTLGMAHMLGVTDSAVAAAVDDAAKTFDRLGARPLADQLDRARTATPGDRPRGAESLSAEKVPSAD
jgi:tetratricopeptide (TPR) repeat protein